MKHSSRNYKVDIDPAVNWIYFFLLNFDLVLFLKNILIDLLTEHFWMFWI